MAEVDTTDERHVRRTCHRLGGAVESAWAPTKDDQLLVVTPSSPHTLVQHEHTALSVDVPSEVHVVLLGEVRCSRMRAPQQTPNVDPAAHEVTEHPPDLAFRAGQAFIRVPLPIGEPDAGARGELTKRLDEPREVGGAVDSNRDLIAGGPSCPSVSTSIDLRAVVAALRSSQKPIVKRHELITAP
jgi:hypothetical protein